MPSLSSYQEADQAARDHALALEDDLAAKLRPLISKLVSRALRNLRAKTRSLTASGAEWTPPDADELMNRHALDQEIAATLASFHSKTVKRVVDGIATELGLSLDLKNPLMVGVLAGQGQKITHISESLRAEVMAQIQDAWERGLSIPDTVALVTEHTAEFSASRAATIARTEIIGTANQASLAAARLSGAAPYKQWLATNDSLTRESHAEADGQTVPIDEPFLVSGYPLDAPGDPSGPAGEVINCFPGDTPVLAASLRTGYRAWYDGDLVTVEDEFGDVLSGTPNHPVLTLAGWKPLGSLTEGDHLVSCRLGEKEAGVDPDVEDAPATCEQAFAALAAVGATRRVAARDVNLYGDRFTAEVDVVRADGLLQHDLDATRRQPRSERQLATSDFRPGPLAGERLAFCLRHAHTLPSTRYVGGGRKRAAFVAGRSRHAGEHGGASVATLDASLAQSAADRSAADTEALCETLLGFAAEVAVAEIIHIGRDPWAGHVYSFESGSGVYLANTIPARNCRCTVVYSDEAGGNDLSGLEDLRASGGRMADTAPTLTPMVVSIEGIDYTLSQPITETGLRTLNPDITDDHLGVLLALTAATPPAEAPVASIGEWTADPLVPFGVATRDGRMVRAGSLAVPAQLPVPLMSMLEDVHGQSMTLPESKLAGAMTTFTSDDARLAASGTFDDTDAGRAAMSAVQDGRMGISADLAVTEYEYVMSQESVDAMQQEMDGEAPVAEDAPASEDVPGGVVVDSGDQADMGMFVVTAGEVMGATIVPFAAFDSARIELTTLAADGHPTHARVVMPLRAVQAVALPAEGNPTPEHSEAVTAPATGLSFDVLPALDAIIAAQRSASGIAPLEALAAALRSERGEAPRPVIDAEVALALVDAIGKASRDPGLVDIAAALAASAARPEVAPAPIIVNPPPVTVHTPDVKVENHPPDVTVNAAGRPRSLRIVRDEAGNAVSYEPLEEVQ